ncbi:MAG: carbon-nitrogen hydrolase family protein [Solirubrobacteraceae bacterium]
MRVAAVQLNATEDVERNLAVADRLTREAAARGAQLVVLPEKWTVLGRADVMQAHAQTLEAGAAIDWARRVAAELGIDLVAGSFVERRAEQAKTSNTSLHIGPDGVIRAAYRKLHMFDVEVDGVLYAESARERPGDQVVLTDVGGHPLGLSICYDLRFPELYRALSRRGAEILAVPAAFTLATTRDHWEVLLRARAIENQCFVIAANQTGSSPPANRCGGRSMIVDPWGIVLATAPDAECTIVADLDFGRMADVRVRLPALAHRREASVYDLDGGDNGEHDG